MMARQNKRVEAKPDDNRRVQAKRSMAAEVAVGLSSGTELANDPISLVGETIEAQAARLSDQRLPSVQRHTLAVHIGQVQGNRHLQRLIATLNDSHRVGSKRGPKGHSIQRHWLPGEEEEVQTKPFVQRQMAADRPSGQVIQKHWLPGEEEEVQTKPLLQRRAIPGEDRMKPPFQQRGVSRHFGSLQRNGPVSHNLWGHNGKTGLLQRQWKTGTAPGAAPAAGPKIGEERVKFDPVTFNPGEIPADGKTNAQANVKTSPAGRTIKWEIVGDDFGSTINGAGVITPGNDIKSKEKVGLQVKATDDKQTAASSSGDLTLWDAKLYQAKKDFPKFVGSTYTYPNFTIGLNGKFDVEYQPAANLANVNVKVKFAFPDDENPKPSIGNLFGLLGSAERKAREARHSTYRDNFIKQITAQWSGRYQFKNVREPQSVWGKLNPTSVKVNVVEVDKNPHFTIEVRQKSKGTAQVGGGTAKLFQGDDVPAPAFNPSTAQGELTRVKRNTPTPILFANNSATMLPADQAKLQFLGTYLSRINNPKFNFDIVGHASATGNKAKNQTLSEQRAQAVAAVLTGAGATQHKLNTRGEGQTGADKSDQWRKVDVASSIPVGWQNMQDVTAHEFGHMIGLGDEYAGGASPVATHYDLVKKAFGQNYADQVAKRGDTDYASIMEGGNDVRIQHYVTFWSGLCETTMKAPTPDPKFGYDDWKFIG